MQSANGTDCLESISWLQELLEVAPPLPERKLSWHCAFEKLLDGTREGEVPIYAIQLRAEKSGRTTDSNGRTGEPGRSGTCSGGVRRQGREWRS